MMINISWNSGFASFDEAEAAVAVMVFAQHIAEQAYMCIQTDAGKYVTVLSMTPQRGLIAKQEGIALVIDAYNTYWQRWADPFAGF